MLYNLKPKKEGGRVPFLQEMRYLAQMHFYLHGRQLLIQNNQISKIIHNYFASVFGNKIAVWVPL